MGFLYYNNVDKQSQNSYPKWSEGKPNLITYLDSINLSQPIVSCQYELRMSRWPRTIFFAKSITIPGISVNTVELNHCGFTIQIPTHPKYETQEITISILADKEGYHYYDWRNMVFQSGHPLIAGDPMSTIGDGEDQLDVRLRNSPNDATHHHWIVRNFRPIKIGDIELSMDSSSFVEFQVIGTFTHIDYDCGKNDTPTIQQKPRIQDPVEQPDKTLDPPMPKTEKPDSTSTSPEPPKPIDQEAPTFDSMKGDIFEIKTKDCSINLNTVNGISLNKENPSNDEIKLASKYQDKLENLRTDLKNKLTEIANMPADPNFNQEDGKVKKSSVISGEVEKSGDNTYVGFNEDHQFKSQAQKDAYDKVVSEYKNQVNNTVQNFENDKQKLNPPKQQAMSDIDPKKRIQLLMEAVKINHDLGDNYSIQVNGSEEIATYLRDKKEAVLFNYGLNDITDEELDAYDGVEEIRKYRNAIIMSKSTLPPRFRFSSWENHISDGEDITPSEYFKDRIKMGEISHLDPDKKKRKEHRSRDIF